MKHLIKKHSKTLLLAGVCLFSYEAFSASEATKKMIHDTLSKFCITPKKENCNPREEGKYDPNYDFCLCEDDGMVYSKSERKCVECGAGTYYRRNMKDNKCKDCPRNHWSSPGSNSCYCDCTYGCDSDNNCLDYCDVHDCTPPEPEYKPDPVQDTPAPSNPTPPRNGGGGTKFHECGGSGAASMNNCYSAD